MSRGGRFHPAERHNGRGMGVRRPSVCLAVITAGVFAAAMPASATADSRTRAGAQSSASSAPDRQGWRSDVTTDGALERGPHAADASHQHGGDVGHLPPTDKNVDLVSKLELTRAFGDVRPEQIADLSSHDGYAYLNSWQSPQQGSCERGGTYVVDIRNIKKPKEVGFIPAAPGSYPGEGSQVVSLDTPFFRGDLMAINSEACATSGTPATRRGGITLVDVTNPRRPVKLAENFGDITPPSVSAAKTNPEHQTHSVFVWQDGDRAYAVMVDNEEFADVDIVDITDPRSPVLIKELDVTTLADIGTAFGDGVFLHDMVVKRIRGEQIMLVSYWDGGHVKLNVDDPANPVFIEDTDYAACDQLIPEACPPEGNAHQAEFSHNNRYIVGTDEDFSPYRLSMAITSGPNNGQRFNAGNPIDNSAKIPDLADEELGPQTRFFGRGCNTDGPFPAPPADDGNPDTDRIAVIERGVCTFAEKADNAEAAGYDGYLIFNNAGRPDGDPLVTNGVLGDTPLPGGFIQRSAALALFGGVPTVGQDGATVSVTPFFDGWGYVRLFDANTMEEIDQYAIFEALDERFASGFGDLSVHETANDPDANLAYLSYYAGGFRVVRFGRRGMREVGRFIDEGGNNFWGVDVYTDKNRKRYVLASDRDYGLYVFRYTGPGAVRKAGKKPRRHGHH